MSISINRYNAKQVNPLMDVLLYEKMFPINGILNGCVLSRLGSNQVAITSGTGIIKGRDFTVTAETLLVALATSGTMPGRIYVRINLANTVNTIQILSVCQATLPALVQDANFNLGNGIWEMELATYSATTTLISALTTTVLSVGTPYPEKKTITWANESITPITSLCYKHGDKVTVAFRMPLTAGIANISAIAQLYAGCIPRVGTGYFSAGVAYASPPSDVNARCFPVVCSVNASGQILIANELGILMYNATVSFEFFVN